MEANTYITSNRKALRMAIASTCLDLGFVSISESAMETLIEMTVSYVHEVGRSSRALAELAGRTQPIVNDVSLALVDIGCDLSALPGFVRQRRLKTASIPSPTATQEPNKPKTLKCWWLAGVGLMKDTQPVCQVGSKRQMPVHIPEYLPPLPDSHAYVRTPTHKPPANEYQLVREKNASQKRDVERALTKFIAKTSSTISLFSMPGPLQPEETSETKESGDGDAQPEVEIIHSTYNSFPLINNKPLPRPYMTALLSRDSDILEDDSSASSKGEKEMKPKSGPEEEVDNPYVRPVKMPKVDKKRR